MKKILYFCTLLRIANPVHIQTEHIKTLMKHQFKIIAMLCVLLPLAAMAQKEKLPMKQETRFSRAFERLDLTLSGGSTGIGFELGAPVHKNVNLRAGFTIMPKVKPVMTFDVEGRNAAGEITSFTRMAEKFKEIFDLEVDEQIDMQGESNFYNFNILVDYFPFKNKNWHITAGVYMGPNEIAHAYNKTEEMISLLSVSIYNNLYEKAMNFEPLFGDIRPTFEQMDMFEKTGRMGIYVGDFKKPLLNEAGDPILDENGKPVTNPYMMEPNENSMVKVRMKTKTWLRPYIGFGYSGKAMKNNDRLHLGFDCGLMYWGGVPNVLTHDGVNLTHDLKNIRGQVNDYVRIAKKFPIYPVLNLNISYRLF